MSRSFHLVKLVSGNAGSKRITIPKEIVKELELENTEYIALKCEGKRRATLVPAKIVVET